mmetsp:Transcript_23696/g.93977  ORF Transcript_23696/g.93977 Transcript_23696/m.93977 type:complete len:249 (-) Transcript_23696:88-834(-)
MIISATTNFDEEEEAADDSPNNSAGTGSGSSAWWPRLVACTTTSKPASVSGTFGRASSTWMFVPIAAASAFARASVRLYTAHRALRCSTALAMARAAPPAPRMSTEVRSVMRRPEWTSRPSTKPRPSKFAPSHVPSGSWRTQLTAPIRRASFDTRAHSAYAASLCGRVMTAPSKLATSASPARAVASASGATRNGTRTTSLGFLEERFRYRGMMREVRVTATGSPMMATILACGAMCPMSDLRCVWRM